MSKAQMFWIGWACGIVTTLTTIELTEVYVAWRAGRTQEVGATETDFRDALQITVRERDERVATAAMDEMLQFLIENGYLRQKKRQ